MPITIRTRLLTGYAIGVIILAIAASIGSYSRHLLFEGLNETREIAEEIDRTQRLSLAIERMLMPVNDYLISGDVLEKDRYDERLMEVMQILARIADTEELMDKGKRLLDDLKREISIINRKAKEIFSHPLERKSEGASLMYDMDKAGEKAYTILNAHAEMDREELKKIFDTSKRSMEIVNQIMIAGTGTVVILGIFLVLYMERSIRLPINRLSEGVRSLNGSHWEKVDIKDGAEITLLANEYNKMIERLRSAHEDLEEKVRERTSELNEINKRLEILSITDGLTGLYNHRYFYDRLKDEMERASRYNRPLSLILLDIDYFKHYNDTHGHMAGDMILREVAKCLISGVRDVDIVARYGGEEFAVIVPEVDCAGATILAERIREIVASKPFPQKETQPNGNLTISCGVASFAEASDKIETLIKSADDALYRAKETGRNRVEAFIKIHFQ